MRSQVVRVALSCAVLFALSAWRPQTVGAADEAGPADAAVREMLMGARGMREAWQTAPVLVILGSVMEYRTTDPMADYIATDEQLTEREQGELASDLTDALATLTGGLVPAFSDVRVEVVQPGDAVKLFRRGAIVVGRFRGVRERAGTLGYGGRTTRDGTITAGAVILDRDYDRNSDSRRMLRTHELGHAIGYNHVVSEPSVMNPRVGRAVTDFDRDAVKVAFARPLH